MSDPIFCLFCDFNAPWRNFDGLQPTCVCPRCGEYDVSSPLRLGMRTQSARDQIPGRHLISGFSREQYEKWKHSGAPVDAPLFVKSDDFNRYAAFAPRTIKDRGIKLLQAIARRTDYFGQMISLDHSVDFPLGYAKNPEELKALVRYLTERNWLRLIDERVGSDGGRLTQVCVTADGYGEIESRPVSTLESGQAFVARFFNKELEAAYDLGIKPAIEASGFVAVPVNAREYNGDIVDQIIVEIRKSRFVVADTTGHRGGVYFEAGFAIGLGLEVIFSCRDGDFDNSHFDVKHMNHIVWKTPEDLRAQLTRRIQATVGFGPGPRASSHVG